jgi:hypothetical protein
MRRGEDVVLGAFCSTRGFAQTGTPVLQDKREETAMAEDAVVYRSSVRIERRKGPLRVATLPGEPQPVCFSVHGAIARHYGIPEDQLPEPHAATLDYVIAATGG